MGNSESELQTPQKIYKANIGFLCLFAFVASLGIFQLGYVLTANNQVSPILDVQFGLIDDNEKKFYHTMIGSSAVLGATVGSFSAGSIIQIGRRKSIIIFNFIAILATFSTLVLNFYAMCAGRFVLGFCGGLFSVSLARMIDETVPINLLGTFGVVTNLSMNAGNMVSILMGAGLPDQDDTQAIKDSNFWRVIFGLPIIIQVIQILAFVLVIKSEPIKYLIDQKKDTECLNAIAKVYDSSQNPHEIFLYLKKTGQKPSLNIVSICQALLGQNYWKATWFCIIFGISLQLTGINALIWYSNNILQRINKETGSGISPRLGTILIGVTNFIGSVVSLFIVKKLGRKPLTVFGNFTMALFLFLIGLFSYLQFNNPMLVMMLLFLFTFQQCDGPLFYMYCSEITVDTALGFAFLSLKGSGLAISLTTEYMMDSPLKPQGVFGLFAGVTFISAIFFQIVMKETRGLTDKQKKDLYKYKFREADDIMFVDDNLEEKATSSQF
eukprot:403365224